MHLLCILVNVKILFSDHVYLCIYVLFYLDAFRILAGTFITDYLCIELRYDHKTLDLLGCDIILKIDLLYKYSFDIIPLNIPLLLTVDYLII